ncbi:hypothetical protein BAA08_16250 [Bizionia sp. APA-3]|nr:hypothetical protein BAA08_16250 [Bizionia sp. APA-3]
MKDFIAQFGLRNVFFITYIFFLLFHMDITTGIFLLYILTFIMERFMKVKLEFNWCAYIFSILPGLIVLIGFLFWNQNTTI